MGSSCSSPANAVAATHSTPNRSTTTPHERGGNAYHFSEPTTTEITNPLLPSAAPIVAMARSSGGQNPEHAPCQVSFVTPGSAFWSIQSGSATSADNDPQRTIRLDRLVGDHDDDDVGCAFSSIQSGDSANSAVRIKAHRSLDPPPPPYSTGVVQVLGGDEEDAPHQPRSGEVSYAFPDSELVSPKNKNEDVLSIEPPRSMIVELAMFQPRNLQAEGEVDGVLSEGSAAHTDINSYLGESDVPSSPTVANAPSFTPHGGMESFIPPHPSVFWQHPRPHNSVHNVPSPPDALSRSLTPIDLPADRETLS